MQQHDFQSASTRGGRSTSFLMGGLFAVGLFVVMALAQMMGDVDVPDHDLTELALAYVPPVVEEIEDELPPPQEAEEAPPELEREPPQLSLDQLDLALNPGTGSLTGDFAMPSIGASARSLGTEDFVDFSDLDRVPRPIGVSGFNFPRRLLKNRVDGKIVLLVRLSDTGTVLDVEVTSSSLPSFDDFVLSEVKGWRFTPPTQDGRPVRAKARLPIPIRVS